jgi:hypothetical protein
MADCATQCTAVLDGLMIQVRGLEKIFGEGESRVQALSALHGESDPF